MKYFLFFVAIIGWLLSLVAHVLSIQDVDIRASVPFLWLLDVGVFIVFAPCIFYLRKRTDVVAALKEGKGQWTLLKLIFSATPLLLTVIAGVSFVYAGVNFALFILSQEGSPAIKGGEFVLHNHGELVRVLDADDYAHYRANEVRLSTGHLMAFYSISMAILFPFVKKTDVKESSKA